MEQKQTLSKSDFVSDQEIRWCPGCGDYSILAAVQKTLPTLGVPIENFVFVSGIGCSSRFPYYLNTYGFHTIHGRAVAVATGIKLANPDLSVWVVTGDGDGLSIGTNHLLHLFRRNLDINVLLFNNRIYGLTKGQYSPTSEIGKKTKSSPRGTIEKPFNPAALALGAGATFVARALAVDGTRLSEIIKCAYLHKGASFVEVLQNCNIFNDGAFDDLSEKNTQKESVLFLENGKPLVFGQNQNKGIALDNFSPRIIDVTKENSKSIIFDSTNQLQAQMVASLGHPEFPTPLGILFQHEDETFEQRIERDLVPAEILPDEYLWDLFCSNYTWKVGP